jgi:hypothetical protein
MDSRRWALVASVFLLTASLGMPPASAGHVDCTYDSASHTITTEGSSADHKVSFFRVGDEIREQFMDCGEATRFNTDKIIVNDPTGHNLEAFILMDAGPFRPGFTDEPGNSDEIEFVFKAGDGTNTLVARGNDAGNFMTGGTSFAGVNLNLNANETTHIDKDVTIKGSVSLVTLQGETGPDTLRADGGVGTGPNSVIKFSFDGGTQSDLIVGGRKDDLAKGYFGADRIRLGAGEDTAEGETGNDRLFGNKKGDLLIGGEGNDLLDGGPGSDECKGGPGTDQKRRCET